MRRKLLFALGMLVCFPAFSQTPLSFSELGYDPAYCRLFPYQSGGGVVYCSATGGTPDYSYEWKNLSTGATSNNTTWGGRSPGCYQITVTDAAAEVLVDTICVDSLNPIAKFALASDDLEYYAGAHYGNGYPIALMMNQSENFANPNNPFADTTFWWNFRYPSDVFEISTDYYEPFWHGFPEGIWDVTLVAQNANGCTDTTSKLIIVFPPLSTGEYTGNGLFVLSADHDAQQIAIQSGGIQHAELTIFDLNGRIVKELLLETDEQTFEFHQPRGLYLYQLKSTELEQPISGKFKY